MKVGIDGTCWGLHRGFGRHTRCLLSELLKFESPHEFVLFLSPEGERNGWPGRVETIVVPTSKPSKGGAGRSLTDILRASWSMSRYPLDVLFFPASYSFVPVFTRAIKLVMFHDVTGFLYPHLVLGSWKDRLLWSWKSRLARYQADRILTVSHHSQLGLARWFGLPESEISVVGEAADPVFRRIPQTLLTNALEQVGVRSGRRYLTYLGGFGPNKNLNRLVTAFAGIADSKEIADVDLVMVGPYENEAFYSTAGGLRQLVKDRGLEERVVFTGFLPDEEMVVLFNLSEAVALVSYNEGFGLPAVEAAACGCPCVATLSSPLPGLLGDGGIFVDPLSVDEIKDGLWAVLADREKQIQMSKAAFKASSQLSWSRAAGQMLELLEQLK